MDITIKKTEKSRIDQVDFNNLKFGNTFADHMLVMDYQKGKIIIYIFAVLVFVILTIEEIKPFFAVSETFDIYDIIGNCLGSICAILTFKLTIVQFRGHNTN